MAYLMRGRAVFSTACVQLSIDWACFLEVFQCLLGFSVFVRVSRYSWVRTLDQGLAFELHCLDLLN